MQLCFKASPKISFIHMQSLVQLHENKTNLHSNGFAQCLPSHVVCGVVWCGMISIYKHGIPFISDPCGLCLITSPLSDCVSNYVPDIWATSCAAQTPLPVPIISFSNFDAQFNAFHHNALPHLLPYEETAEYQLA